MTVGSRLGSGASTTISTSQPQAQYSDTIVITQVNSNIDEITHATPNLPYNGYNTKQRTISITSVPTTMTIPSSTSTPHNASYHTPINTPYIDDRESECDATIGSTCTDVDIPIPYQYQYQYQHHKHQHQDN